MIACVIQTSGAVFLYTVEYLKLLFSFWFVFSSASGFLFGCLCLLRGMGGGWGGWADAYKAFESWRREREKRPRSASEEARNGSSSTSKWVFMVSYLCKPVLRSRFSIPSHRESIHLSLPEVRWS